MLKTEEPVIGERSSDLSYGLLENVKRNSIVKISAQPHTLITHVLRLWGLYACNSVCVCSTLMGMCGIEPKHNSA